VDLPLEMTQNPYSAYQGLTRRTSGCPPCPSRPNSHGAKHRTWMNQTRQHQKNVAIAQTVNDAVAKEVRDVDRETFWNFGRRAQAETPRNLVYPSARIEWQMRRMIELTRAKHQAVITAASSSAPRAGVSPSPAPGAPIAAG
jgi:hypothetical protein